MPHGTKGGMERGGHVHKIILLEPFPDGLHLGRELDRLLLLVLKSHMRVLHIPLGLRGRRVRVVQRRVELVTEPDHVVGLV